MPSSGLPSAASPSLKCRPSRRRGYQSAAPISRRILRQWRCSSHRPARATSPGKPTMSMADWSRTEPPPAFTRCPSDRSPPSATTPAERAPAVFLRLGRPGLLVLRRLRPAGPAVSTLSVFVEPLTRDFGWSRTALSGAVSLGGILAAIISPRIGVFLDRAGSRLMLCYAVSTTGAALLALSLTSSLVMFYALFC